MLEHAARNLFSKTFIKEKVTWRYHTYHNILGYFIVITSVSLLSINQDWTNTKHKKKNFTQIKNIIFNKNGGHFFFFDGNRYFYFPFITNPKILNVFSAIKIYKRSLNGTTIYTRNYLFGNASQNCFFFLLIKMEMLLLVQR